MAASKEASRQQLAAKVVFLGLNALGGATGAWLLFGGLTAITAGHAPDVDLGRRILIVTFSSVYFLRIIGTTFLMPRVVGMPEAIGVGIWIVIIHLTMAISAGFTPGPLGVIALIGIAMYVIGSLLNSVSEYLRKIWKDDPANAGKVYTGGLFRYSVHINYFGDVVLFTGFALVTGSAWALIIPALMVCLFVFYQIPALDKHLAEHYGEEFRVYRSHTKRFVPFVY
jgi:protein-S-isoprenylcysteine O-methyltransferase Ste14